MKPESLSQAGHLRPFNPLYLAIGLALFVGACGNKDQKVGGFTNDLTGNEIEVTALPDPKLPQVTCYFGSFNRSLVDRLGNGNWFENPSNTAVDCRATGPIEAASLTELPKNAEVFSKGTSLLFKSIALRRIVDVKNETIVYVSYSRELVGASAKLGMSVVPVTPTPEPAAAPKAP
jgi:CreA protein